MPLTYHIDADAGLINLTGEDHLALGDLLRCAESLLEDSRFDPELPQLLDLRRASFNSAKALPDDPRLLTLMNRFNARVVANIAVIVPGDLPKHQIAEIYRFTCQFNRAELFEDFDHAMRWLIKTEFVGAALDA